MSQASARRGNLCRSPNRSIRLDGQMTSTTDTYRPSKRARNSPKTSVIPGKDIIQSLPPELFLKIVSHIPLGQQLPLQLVSKTFKRYSDAHLKQGIPALPKSYLIRIHQDTEALLAHHQPLNSYICTHCGKVKATTSFSDNQARKKNPKRICISCAIENNKYTIWAAPRINQILRLPCKRCKTASMPLDAWHRRVLATELYYDVPGHDAHCEECLEEEIGCKVEGYRELKGRTGKGFEDLVLERRGVEEWCELGIKSGFEKRLRLESVSVSAVA